MPQSPQPRRGIPADELLAILRCPLHPEAGRLARRESPAGAPGASTPALRCPECGRGYPIRDGIPDLLVRTPDNAAFIDLEAGQWDEQSASYDDCRRRSAEYAAGVAGAVEALAPRAGELILDAGCGTGLTIRRYRDVGCGIVALDVSFASLQRLRAAAGEEVPCVRADIEYLPFAAGAFDRALCANALQHIPLPHLRERCIAELARVVRPGGRVAVTAHQYSRPKQRRGWNREGRAAAYSGRIRFIHRFEEPEFRRLLAGHLQLERVLGAGYPLAYRFKLSPLSQRLEPLLRRRGLAVPWASMLIGIGSAPPRAGGGPSALEAGEAPSCANSASLLRPW